MANPSEALDMSDEEFLKLGGASAFKQETTTTDTDDSQSDDGIDDSNTDDKTDESDSNNIEEDGDDIDEEDKSEDSDKTQDESDDKKADNGIDNTDKTDPTASQELDYAAIGKQLMSEFKANGTTMKMKSVEDAIQLMQMGANYHKKMAGLKPSLKTLKLLENHGLLNEAKLNYLIDLSQKKPEAITQLLKDSKIDPVTIDLEAENTYVPETRTVNDKDLLLDEVLDSISDSPTYSKTLTVLGEEWDAASRASIVQNPEAIRAINAHMESGIYDQVAQAIAYERSLGKLVGLSDYDAYQRVGSYMHENNLFTGATGRQTTDTNTNTNSTPKTKTESDAQIQERLNRKQAASPSRQQKTVVKDTTNYNPLEMSDEDFIKLNKLRI